MIVDRVNFNEDAIRMMSRDEFISRHIGLVWRDRDIDTRKKMLREVFDMIKPPGQKKETEN